MSRKVTGFKHPVEQLSLDGELIKIWPSATDAAKHFQTSQGNISNCARGERKKAQGFKWRYLLENENPEEIWKPHPDLNIRCSNLGRIELNKYVRTFGQSTREGYWRIRVNSTQGRKNFSVHRLICETWYPSEKIACDSRCENRAQVDHIDKNRSNNVCSNLRWVTPVENIQYRYRSYLCREL